MTLPVALRTGRGDELEKRLPIVFEQGLVTPHPGAAAARKNESAGGPAPGFPHEMMITLDARGSTLYPATVCVRMPTWVPLANRMVYICFLLFWGIMTSDGLYAADRTGSAYTAATIVRADSRTGRLVRTVVINSKVIPPKAVASGPPAKPPAAVDELVNRAAKAYNVDPLLVHSVIEVESGYNPYAVSSKGAEGLMQLIPSTAKRFGVTNSFDPGGNIEAGVRYLRYLQNIFGDDRLALAAYNAGEGAVAKYGWIPPYAETRQYVDRVGKKYSEALRAAARKPVVEQSARPAAPIEEHPKLEQYRDEQGRICLRTR